jgi:hypothetical protein
MTPPNASLPRVSTPENVVSTAGMTVARATPIKVQLREIAQLFNSMDPSPFHDRDLDADAEEFILSWAREVPPEHEVELVIHLETMPSPERAAGVEQAVKHYFEHRAEMKQREYRQLLRHGRISLLVSLIFLATCLFLSELFARFDEGTLARIVKEGFTIAGWVAMWKPLQVYLYDWWPVRSEVRIFQRLARMRVLLVVPMG